MAYEPDAYDAVFGNILVNEAGVPDADQSEAVRLALAAGFPEDEVTSALAEILAGVAECPRCGKAVDPSELVTWQTARQTHWEPAEHEDGCVNCCPRQRGDDDDCDDR